MKNKMKLLLKFVGVFVLCFIVIYLIMFFWGWRLIETGNPILIEVVFAAILSIFCVRLEKQYPHLKRE